MSELRVLTDAELDIIGGGSGYPITGVVSVISELSSLPKLVSEATKGLGALFVIKQIVPTIFLTRDAPRSFR
jgi:hypothetical protein